MYSNMDDDQGEPGLDYNDPNLNPLVCDLCKKTFPSLDELGEHQKKEHDM
ncbi:MAG: C2H2-type zinc finger protein [Nitrososphaeraceae archaeon]|nr:C2H2-type zinc finger protein [Nitrososphaeraceae archaeon]